MNNKKLSIRLRLGSLVLLLFFPACTDLDNDEKDSLVIETEGGTASGDPAALLESIYTDKMGSITDQANTYALYEHTTDEMIPPTRGTDWGDNGVWRQLYQHSWDPTHTQILGTWNQMNERVFLCNQVLGSNPTAAQAAQARFLRAFFMWHVMDLFGKVPFREIDEGVEVDPRVFTRPEAFDYIVNDLTTALPNLENTGPKAQNNIPTQAAANAMLARLYLNRAVYVAANPDGPYTFEQDDMNKVIEYADAVAAAGYSLEDDYFTNFTTAATNEIIFTSAAGSPENRWRMTLHYDQNPDGWNGFATLADFYAKFDDVDERKGNYPPPDGSEYSGIGRGFLVGQQYNDAGEEIINSRNRRPLAFTPEVPLVGASTEQGIRVIKYHPSDRGQYILLRYADVFLMKAEAVMRGGTAGQTALELVNELRAARNAPALTELNESVMLDERGRELYWEGYRRVDLVRFGRYNATWQDKENTEAFRVLFPIPQQALDSNPSLTQNPGYTGAN